MKRWRGWWLTVLLTAASAAFGQSVDGRWELLIGGHNSYLFGEPGIGGGLRMPWEVAIQFRVSDGEFGVGSGSARWLGRAQSLSQPPGTFSCERVAGSYLDSNLSLHETPRVRFAAFPVAGEVDADRIRLRPGYGSPGNYLAVTYQCSVLLTQAGDWLARAERGKQILGKRQDAETRIEGDRLSVRVREVISLPPLATLDMPLQDGWTFSQGSEDDASLVRYRLQRLDP